MSPGDCDDSARLAAIVADAAHDHRPLYPRGGGSKDFLGREPRGAPLDLTAHHGIVAHEPGELVLTARAGTPLATIEAVLTGAGQMLAFEPPHFGPDATLGGTIACGLSGPRRSCAGAARDFVLGLRMIDGRARVLSFGGQVMKNVAGYDIARLMTGSMGTLGILLDISLKVLPRPACEYTRVFALDHRAALERLIALGRQPLPLTASCHVDGQLALRFSGDESTVDEAVRRIGGDPLDAGDAFWAAIREQEHAAFRIGPGQTLWRLSLPPAASLSGLPTPVCTEWGGALRWIVTEQNAASVHAAARTAGGWARRFRGGQRNDASPSPVSPAFTALNTRLRAVFDPHGIFDANRLDTAT